MRKLGKKVTLDKRSLQAYKFCVCSNCPCPSGTSSYSAKASDSERVSKVVESYYLQIKTVYAQRKMSSFVEDFSHPGGPCIPGTHKLFVNVKGDFYPCEKVCECSADTIIGNIDKGFDLDKAETLLNVGKLTEEQCRDCWCAKYCYICTAHLDQGDGLSRELKQKHCAGVRKSIENDFKDYCLLHEMSGLDDDVIYLN